MPDPSSSKPTPFRTSTAVFQSGANQTALLGIEQLDILLRLIAAAKQQVKSFACLGSDLAVLAGAIQEEHPDARGVLVDFSVEIMGRAMRELPTHGHRLSTIQLEQSSTDCQSVLARLAPLDAVVIGPQLKISSIERREFFAGLFHLLNPEGILLCTGDVPSVTRWTNSLLDDYAIDAVFGDDLRRHAGQSRQNIARAHFARLSQHGEAVAPLEVQCDWLREAGFQYVDCYSKLSDLTVFAGQRPPISQS